jgi:alkyl sulfatase BDS1-like metallo-beta-lactamase superfamily hydrolase
MMGGAGKVLARGRQLNDQGKYLLAQEILNKLVQAQPQNQKAKDLLADVFEQIAKHIQNTLRSIIFESRRLLCDAK